MQTEVKKNQECKLKTSKVTFKESLMGACTNIIYKLGAIGGLKRVPHLLRSEVGAKGQIILGEPIFDKMIARQRMSKIIWFTYRQKLKIAEDINSDVGWGCLPRVGQMVLAQALMRFYQLKGEPADQKLYVKVIRPFIDDSEHSSNYSLSMMLKYARRKYEINPGQWFNIGQLSDVMKKVQDEIPLKGSQNLKIAFFSQSVIFLNFLYKRANLKQCRCQIKVDFCKICNSKIQKQPILEQIQSSQNVSNSLLSMSLSNQPKIQLTIIQQQQNLPEMLQNSHSKDSEISEDPLPEQDYTKNFQIYDQDDEGLCRMYRKQSLSKQIQLQNHLLMIVSVRIAQKTIDQFDYNSLLSLLSLPCSLGIIGGVPSKALYLVGYAGNQIIYLDPHYVQEHVDNQNFNQHLYTFFCTEYRTINKQALDPSMAFCFYLRSIQDIHSLMTQIQLLKKIYAENNRSFFISDKANNKQFAESPQNKASFQYSSLEFRDLTDSY